MAGDSFLPDDIVFEPVKKVDSVIPDEIVFEAMAPKPESTIPETIVFEPMAPKHVIADDIAFPAEADLPPEKKKPWETEVEEDEFPVDSDDGEFAVDEYVEEEYVESEDYDDGGDGFEYEVDALPDWD